MNIDNSQDANDHIQNYRQDRNLLHIDSWKPGAGHGPSNSGGSLIFSMVGSKKWLFKKHEHYLKKLDRENRRKHKGRLKARDKFKAIFIWNSITE